MLLHYAKADSFALFTKSDLRHYKTFVEVMKTFRSFYSLDAFSLRQIDVYLWLAGKESFPPNYAKRKVEITAPATSAR